MALNLERYAPTFSVEIGGKYIPELNTAIISLEVEESLEEPSMFTLNMNEGLDPETQEFRWLDNAFLDPGSGKDVEIYIGYAGTTKPSKESKSPKEQVITGRIATLSPSFPSGGMPTLTVQGYDHSFFLQKSFPKKGHLSSKNNYSDIIKDIAQRNSLEVGEIDTTIKLRGNISRDPKVSDYDVLRDLAHKIGYEFFVRNKRLYFRKPKENQVNDQTNDIILLWGRDIINFSPRMSTANAVNEVKVICHNQKDPSKPIIGIATSKDMGFREPRTRDGSEFAGGLSGDKVEPSIYYVPVCDEKNAKAIAEALFAEANGRLIEGDCESMGIPGIRPGMNVNIGGVGKRFSGRYYVETVRHSVNDSGYTMSLGIRRGGVGVV